MIGKKRIEELERRVSTLELRQNGICEVNAEFWDMHRSEQEINQEQLELFEGVTEQMEWMNGMIALLSFATAGLLVGLLDSHFKMAALKKMMNEG